MSKHHRSSPYEPDSNDGSQRNSRQEPPEHDVHTGLDDAPEQPATPAVETLPDDEESAVVEQDES